VADLTIVEKINSLLALKKISKSQFYKDCDISSAAFSQWRTGKTFPSRGNVLRIAEYLDVSPEYLLASTYAPLPPIEVEKRKPSFEDEEGSVMVDRIRALCKARNTSITKLEAALGFGNGTIGKWKNAKNAPPADKLEKVADFLDVSVRYLLTGETLPPYLPPIKSVDEKNPAPTNGDGKTYKEQLLDLIDDIAAHGTRDDLIDVLAAITAAMLKK